MPKNVDTKGFFEGRLISCRGKQKVRLSYSRSPYVSYYFNLLLLALENHNFKLRKLNYYSTVQCLKSFLGLYVQKYTIILFLLFIDNLALSTKFLR